MQKSNGLFTARQAAVIDALRQGKPNKIIAYELKMRESTVKVHVRNIMKKLNATNRTQVAYLVTQLSDECSLLVPRHRCQSHVVQGLAGLRRARLSVYAGSAAPAGLPCPLWARSVIESTPCSPH